MLSNYLPVLIFLGVGAGLGVDADDGGTEEDDAHGPGHHSPLSITLRRSRSFSLGPSATKLPGRMSAIVIGYSSLMGTAVSSGPDRARIVW